MKLMTLNIWGGRAGRDQLLVFLKSHAKNVDIFCFQEVYNAPEHSRFKKELIKDPRFLDGAITDFYTHLQKALPDFESMHSESFLIEDYEIPASYGLAIFVKKGLSVVDQGTYELFKLNEESELGLSEGVRLWNRLLQHVTFPYKDSELTIFNLHGLYTGGGKEDEPGRLEQSARIKKIFQQHKGKKILCGDFNVNPQTESMAILETGMRNLIKEFGITSTRSHYYKKNLKFADYMLVSPEITINEFKVIDEPVSDHLPVYLDFS